MRMISLFAGIGAVEMAAKRVYDDVNILAAAEIDKFARQSYMAIHDIDEDHFYADVKKMDASKYKGMVDLLAFGFPCQDYSIAGKRAGLEGQRGTLFWEGARIINECRPKVFIAENVKGLLSSNGGKDFEVIMDILRNELGYFCHWEVLNSKDYGVPQNRERVFIVGFLDHEAYYRFQFAPKIPLTKRLKDVLESEVDEKYYLSAKMTDYLQKAPRAVKPYDGTQNEAPCLQTMQGGNREPKIVAMRGRNPENPKSRESGLETVQMIEPNENGTSNCLTSVQKDNLVLEPSYRIRKLTPLECWRLQDFPDEAHGKAKAAGVSDSRRYQQAGNSITVAVVEMIFNQINKAISGKKPKDSLF